MTKAVLLSIDPEWAEAILSGKKKWEYRREPPAIDPPYDLLLYATSPIQKILGGGIVDHELRDDVEVIINKTINETPQKPDDIRGYFEDKTYASALEIVEPYWFPEPFELDEHPPQNFKYVNKEDILV